MSMIYLFFWSILCCLGSTQTYATDYYGTCKFVSYFLFPFAFFFGSFFPADGLALGAAAGLSKADVEMVIFVAIMLHKVSLELVLAVHVLFAWFC